MDIKSFNDNGEWLKGNNSPGSIILSTRVRLARNISHRIFPPYAGEADKKSVSAEIHDIMLSADCCRHLLWHDLESVSELDRKLLIERHLISRELAEAAGARAVAFDEAESLSLMVNEEDHLRLQCLRSGLYLQEAFEEIDRLDNELGEKLDFAFDERFGYLTSCPTNVGTGLRISVMLHLPALVMTRHIEKAFRAIHEMRMAVRGFYGEGTEALGDLYQISNQVTCGKSEADILADLEAVILSLVQYEEKARTSLLLDEQIRLEDRVFRGAGLLKTARLMNTEEAMRHLSSLRLGVALGILKNPEIKDINRLFLLSQPAHLQKLAGRQLDNNARDKTRALFLRKELERLTVF